MIEPIAPLRWLFQPVKAPLIAFFVLMLLPAGFLAKIARQKVSERFGFENGN